MNAHRKLPFQFLICVANWLLILSIPAIAADDLSAVESALLKESWREVITLAEATSSSDLATRATLGRYKAIALRETRRETDAQTQIDKLLKELTSAGKSGLKGKSAKLPADLEESRQRLQFEKARLLLTQTKKRQQGITILEELSHSSSSSVAPVALHCLAIERERADNIDGAALAFNLSRDAFPDAVGEEQLIDLLAGDESSPDESAPAKKSTASTEETATRATNTRYSIQLGVFSAKANADAILVKVSSKKLPGTIEKKLVSGKNYFAALVGSFMSLADAQRVRDSLETAHNASFTVITR